MMIDGKCSVRNGFYIELPDGNIQERRYKDGNGWWKSESMSRRRFEKKIQFDSWWEVVFYEKIFKKSDNPLNIIVRKGIECIFFEGIIGSRVLKHSTKRNFSRFIESGSTEGFDWEFLFNTKDAYTMGNIGSPSEDAISRQYDIVCIEKGFIDWIKIVLQLKSIHS